MIRNGNSLFNIGGSIPCLFDLDASKVIEAVRSTGVTITPAMRYYAHYLISNAKNIGTWQLSNSFYGFVGGTAASHKWNWKDLRDVDAAFRLTFVGGVTHSFNGFNGNGTTGYANTFLVPNTNLSTSINLGIYTRSSQYDTLDCLGAYRISEPTVRMIIRASSYTNIATGLTSLSSNDRVDSAAILSKGYYAMNSNSSALQNWFNGNLISGTNTSYGVAGKSTRSFTLGAIGEGTASSFYSNRNFAFTSIGAGLTNTQATQQSQIVTNAQAILNRL